MESRVIEVLLAYGVVGIAARCVIDFVLYRLEPQW